MNEQTRNRDAAVRGSIGLSPLLQNGQTLRKKNCKGSSPLVFSCKAGPDRNDPFVPFLHCLHSQSLRHAYRGFSSVGWLRTAQEKAPSNPLPSSGKFFLHLAPCFHAASSDRNSSHKFRLHTLPPAAGRLPACLPCWLASLRVPSSSSLLPSVLSQRKKRNPRSDQRGG